MIVTLLRGLLYSTLSNTPQQIAEKALAATVSLEIKDTNDAILSRGSGFFVRHDLIATNYHVIKEAAQGTAKLVGKETKYTIEGITATDKKNDLTLLKVTVQGIIRFHSATAIQFGLAKRFTLQVTRRDWKAHFQMASSAVFAKDTIKKSSR